MPTYLVTVKFFVNATDQDAAELLAVPGLYTYRGIELVRVSSIQTTEYPGDQNVISENVLEKTQE